MVEAVLSFVVEETLARVLSPITDEIAHAWNLKDDLKELQESLAMIRAVLQDAEEQQMTREPVRLWLRELKDVAYDAEDVFDELAYETLRGKVKNFNRFYRATTPVKSAAFRVKLAHKVKNIKKLLDKIKNDAAIAGHGITSSNRVMPQINLDRVTDSILDNPVVGREIDAAKIVNLLTHFCNQQDLTIVPIVGMGGLGKTALAKLVCQEVIAKKMFDVKIWVCVSENFDEQKILGEMLQSLNGTTGGLTNRDAIMQQLEKALGRKKFFLVLDDVWDDAARRWDDLKRRLLKISSSQGNAVVVTTRSEQVASVVETSSEHRHTLDLLSDDECWSILKERAFGSTSIPSNLEFIGTQIAKKCKGVPLIAKVLGGTMGFNRDEEAWMKIRDSSVLSAADNKENVEPILKLSFDLLPSYLKPCFAYCSVFPKDFSIEKEQLIQLWMAEGFVESCDGEKGNKHFNALLQNSFFQDVERDEGGEIVRSKMHDLVHDLALSLSKFETLTLENYSETADTSSIRRLCGDDQLVTTLTADKKDLGEKLRTIILDGTALPESWKLKSLRTLKLNGADVEELPSSFGKLKHLRYLDISNTKIKAWPKSIAKLYNLRTLKFCMCEELTRPPGDKMSNLINLKHIDFSYAHQMPAGLSRLNCLETLPFFVVGDGFGGSIQELECLNELRGQLSIRGLQAVRDKQEAYSANLSRKRKIAGLVFEWRFPGTPNERVFRSKHDAEVLQGLQPHPNLKKMKIFRYLGEKFPSWMSGMKSPSGSDALLVLNNLVDLTLTSCWNCKQLPELGSLPCLKFLEISDMGEVRRIGNEFYGIRGGRSLFPALKSFSLSVMKNLIEWNAPCEGDEDGDKIVVFPCLEELSIDGCLHLTKIPVSDLSSLVKLNIDNCEELEYLVDELQSSFPCVRNLKISRCKSLTCLPIQSNMSMEELHIWGCPELTHVPQDLGKLSSLTSLRIESCFSLSYFPEGILSNLTRLEKLSVGDFSWELDGFHFLNGIQDLPYLKELSILVSSVMSLPDQLQLLTALESLTIWYFQMEELPDWLVNLHSLQFLNICYCPHLNYQSTATLVKRLPELRHLRISGCPVLKEDDSEYWFRFSRSTKIKVSLNAF